MPSTAAAPPGSPSRYSNPGWDPLNPNRTWILTPGLWLWYTLVVLAVHLVLLAIPVVSTATARTLTNLFHAAVSVSAHAVAWWPVVQSCCVVV